MKPAIFILSSPSFVASGLVDFLLSQKTDLDVVVVSQDNPTWRELAKSFPHQDRLKLESLENSKHQAAHAFLLAGFGPEDEDIKKSLQWLSQEKVKTFAILPLIKNAKTEKLLEVIRQNQKEGFELQIVFLGEPLGATMLINDWPLSRILFSAATQSVVSLPIETKVLYFGKIEELVRELTRAMFSYGYPWPEWGLTGKANIKEFTRELKKFKPELAFHEDSAVLPNQYFTPKNVVYLKENDFSGLKELFFGLEREIANLVPVPQTSPPVRKQEKRKRLVLKSFLKKKLVLGLGLVLTIWFLILPFLMIFASGVSLNIAYSQYSRGQVTSAKTFLRASKTLAPFSQWGVGGKINFVREASQILTKSASLAEEAVEASERGFALIEAIFRTGDYDLVSSSTELALKLTSLYEEASFLETEIRSLPLSDLGFLPDISRFKEVRQYLLAGSEIARNLPTLLGNDKAKTYLVLLQNNMELRPAGGFIGSFALVTFDKGKLIDLNIMDVYSADGQLKGHVEPPQPIKDYLGEANWYLRDANWDPDFPTSAARVEWFLEKELGRIVDGVVALDLEVAQSLISETGPITLADYNQTIDEKNLYERVQYEVEADFFPGSRKKANFLTALTRGLLEKLLQEEGGLNYLSLAKKIISDFNGRHIQVFLHNEDLAQVFSNLSWDGAVEAPFCTGNCQSLMAGLVEANLGVNKANYFVSRSARLDTHLADGKLINRLEVSFENRASAALGLSATYKNYLRLIVDKEAQFADARILDLSEVSPKSVEVQILANRKEGGVLLEVKPGAKKTVIFEWSKPLTADANLPGEFLFYFRKQAGVPEMPFTANFDLGALTKLRPNLYNTNLETDFKTTISWK